MATKTVKTTLENFLEFSAHLRDGIIASLAAAIDTVMNP